MNSGGFSNALFRPQMQDLPATPLRISTPQKTSRALGIVPRRGAEEPSSWYVVQVLSQKEGYAAEHLERQGFRTFFPRFYRNRSHARKTETVLAPLFPGYIFVKFDIEMDRWLAVNSTRGVVRLVGPRPSEPQPVPAIVIENLMDRCRAGVLTKIPDHIRAGDCVQINAGPLAGQVATIESLNDQRRISVLFSLLGTEHSILVNANQLATITLA